MMVLVNETSSSTLSAAIAEVIRAERMKRNLRQQDLSDASGIPITTIRRLEYGSTIANVTQLEDIGSVFNMTGLELYRLASDWHRTHSETTPPANVVIEDGIRPMRTSRSRVRRPSTDAQALTTRQHLASSAAGQH